MNIDLDLTYKQAVTFEYLTDDVTTEVLFGGSAGGGKSFFGCAWLIINCLQYPGTRWLMGRSKLKALKQTTLNTFFDVCSQWGIKQDEHFNYNQMNNEIKFSNGSEIILKDLFLYPSDPNFDSLGSLEITGAFIDEVNQITEKAKNIVASRMRYRLDEFNLIPKLFMSCNPAKNWVYNEFYKKDKDKKLEIYKKFIPALATDNPHISKHYIEQLSKLDEVSKKRLLNGEWEYEDKSALIKFDSIIELFKDFEAPKNKGKKYITVDVARKGKDKAVMMVWDGLDVIEMHSMDVSLITDLEALLNTLKNKYGVNNRNVVIDSDGVGGGLADLFPKSYNFVNGSKSLHKENYQNLKTQCYFKLADAINNGDIRIFNYTIEEREAIIKELAAVKRKNIDKDGKLQIIPKDEVKAMLGHSPDYSDCLMMRMVYELKSGYKIAF